MAIVTLAEYRKFEEQASLSLPADVAATAAPIFSRSALNPNRIDSEGDIERLLNITQIQHDGLRDLLERGIGGISASDFRQLEHMMCITVEVIEDSIDKTLVPVEAMLESLAIWRMLRYVFGGQKLSILEIGPGSGYIGMLALLESVRYTAVDFDEAHYVWHNRMYEAVCDDAQRSAAHTDALNRLFEGLPCQDSWVELNRRGLGLCAHVPWWHLINPQCRRPPAYDLILLGGGIASFQDKLLNLILASLCTAVHSADDSATLVAVPYLSSFPVEHRSVLMHALLSHSLGLIHYDSCIALFAPEGHVLCKGSLPSAQCESMHRQSAFSHASELNPVSKIITLTSEINREFRRVPLKNIDTLVLLLKESAPWHDWQYEKPPVLPVERILARVTDGAKYNVEGDGK